MVYVELFHIKPEKIMASRKKNTSAKKTDRQKTSQGFSKNKGKKNSSSLSSRENRLLFGTHPVLNALLNKKRTIHSIWTTEKAYPQIEEALIKARNAGLHRPDPMIVDKDFIEERVPDHAIHQNMLIDCAPLPTVTVEDLTKSDQEQDLLVILDQVTDPHNIGAILRSASAFGARAVILQDRNAPEVTGTLAKSACGAVESVPLVRVTNLGRAMEHLQENGYWIIGLAESGTGPLASFDLTGKTVVAMGAEGPGLRRLTMEKCDGIAWLPTQGLVQSLNVSNASAVTLYEAVRQRAAKTS